MVRAAQRNPRKPSGSSQATILARQWMMTQLYLLSRRENRESISLQSCLNNHVLKEALHSTSRS